VPRELTIPTRELGELKLLIIYSKAGVWESSWRVLQGGPYADLFTVTLKVTMDHALRGWTSPLVKGLGIPPVGALRKLPTLGHSCYVHSSCPMYHRRECVPSHKSMPWCFQPSGLVSDEERRLAAEVIQKWRDGVYLVVVDEP